MPPKLNRTQPNYSDGAYVGNGGRSRNPERPRGNHHRAGSHSKPRHGSGLLKHVDSVESLNRGMNSLHFDGARGGPWQPAGQESVSSGDGISAEEVEAILECPICFEVPRAPIFNCQTGHTVCGDCRKKVSSCPLCRQGFTNVRNFIAEKLAETLNFRCPFGCEAQVKKSQEDEHMQLCNFRPVGCEVYPCRGSHIEYGTYLEHLKKVHRAMSSSGTQTKACRVIHVKKPERLMEQGHRVPYTISCFGQTFLQYTQAVGGKIWFWVSLFGTPEEAKRFRVTLTLSSKAKDLKNIWIGSVHSVRHSGDDIYLNGLCMVMTEECLKAYFYRHDDGFQAYGLEIHIEKKCTPEVRAPPHDVWSC